MVVAACMRPTQDKARENPNINGEEAHEVSPLVDELVIILDAREGDVGPERPPMLQ